MAGRSNPPEANEKCSSLDLHSSGRNSRVINKVLSADHGGGTQEEKGKGKGKWK